jgi:hypothetical protein
MTRPPSLRWTWRRSPSWRVAAALLIVLAAIAGLLRWQASIGTRMDRAQSRLDRVDLLAARAASRVAHPSDAPSPTASRQLGEQLQLLNRDWVALSARLVPRAADVRLLGLDANPGTGVLRVSGRAPTAELANAYAEELGHVATLRDVRLLALERRDGMVDFEVGATWLP